MVGRSTSWIAWLVILMVSRGLSAAVISEVSTTSRSVFSSGGQTVTLPTYVEVSELQPLGAVDLIIIDARNSTTRYGQILHIITLGGSQDVRLASGGSWPANFSNPPAPAGTVTENPTALDLTGSRALLVIDRATTGLNVGSKLTRGSSVVGGGQVLDVVTIGATASTWAWATESIISLDSATALARTSSSPEVASPDMLLTGVPDSFNQLPGYSPMYVLNPGFANHHWSPAAIPEPGTLLLTAGGLFMLLYRRTPAIPDREP